MGGRCARVDGEFLGLVGHKGSGLVVKLPRERVAALIEDGVGRPFAGSGSTCPALGVRVTGSKACLSLAVVRDVIRCGVRDEPV